jgi:hypothetical protein
MRSRTGSAGGHDFARWSPNWRCCCWGRPARSPRRRWWRRSALGRWVRAGQRPTAGPQTVRGQLAGAAMGCWRCSACAALAGSGAADGCARRAGPSARLGGAACPRHRSPTRPARPMTPATGGGDGEPGSASAPARRKLIFGPESWREPAGGSWSHWNLWFCTVAVPGFDATRPGSATRSRGAAHAPWSGLDWEAKLSHLEDLHARLAAVDQDAGQLAGEPPTTWSRRCCDQWRPSCKAAGCYPAEVAMALVAYL